MTHTLTVTKAREDLTKLVEDANKKLEEYIITVNGLPTAALISYEEYESWKETNEIMSDPIIVKIIKQGEKEIDQGKGANWEDVKKELALD